MSWVPLKAGLGVFALPLAVGACHGEADEQRRAEAGHVAEAVRQVREAPNAGKAPLLSALRATTCVAPDVCELKAGCVAAYGAEQSALDGIAAVRRAVRDGNAPPEAALLLQQATSGLADATVLTKKCADVEADVRRHYSL